MSGMGLTLGSTRDNEIGQDGIIGLQSPADVPEIAAGYWWHPSMAVGLGGAAFAVPEGNGHATFALVQANPLNQPTVLTENGGVQFRMRKTADPNPCVLGTAGNVSAGWTGPTYIGVWHRLPDNAGVSAGNSGMLAHTLSGTNNRRFSVNYTTGATPGRLQVTSSSTGLLQSTNTSRSTSTHDGNWHYIEMIFDFALVLGGASPADVIKHFSDLVRRTLTTVPTTAPASLFDASCNIYIGLEQALLSVDNFDWAACYYGNGIPSLGNRLALSRWRAPV